ncbi:MAG: type VI secretion system contractile sheath small subunit [Myxococcales bacterium]|nr:type VI secretion system contractile sheath small subunit [Myxococcales bacterium]MCB9732620.1 type VI secretion system contractile sheath small subunit [Deltaproteobacteria bacterium]
MILGALLISIAAVLVLAAVIAGAQKELKERRRQHLEKALSEVMSDVKATSHDEATGTLNGLPTRVHVGHDLLTATVTLPEAVLTYEELLGRFGTRYLRGRLTDHGAAVKKDELELSVVNEQQVEDSIATLVSRLEIAAEVLALRDFVPAELLARIPQLHSAVEVDQTLDALTTHFPRAPETRDAFAAAMARYGKDKKLAARAEAFLATAR